MYLGSFTISGFPVILDGQFTSYCTIDRDFQYRMLGLSFLQF